MQKTIDYFNAGKLYFALVIKGEEIARQTAQGDCYGARQYKWSFARSKAALMRKVNKIADPTDTVQTYTYQYKFVPVNGQAAICWYQLDGTEEAELKGLTEAQIDDIISNDFHQEF